MQSSRTLSTLCVYSPLRFAYGYITQTIIRRASWWRQFLSGFTLRDRRFRLRSGGVPCSHGRTRFYLSHVCFPASARIKLPTPAIFITCSISLVSFCLPRIDSYSLRK